MQARYFRSGRERTISTGTSGSAGPFGSRRFVPIPAPFAVLSPTSAGLALRTASVAAETIFFLHEMDVFGIRLAERPDHPSLLSSSRVFGPECVWVAVIMMLWLGTEVSVEMRSRIRAALALPIQMISLATKITLVRLSERYRAELNRGSCTPVLYLANKWIAVQELRVFEV